MFRDDNPQCPQCSAALDPVGPRWRCTPCSSTFLGDAELTPLFNELSPDDERPVAARVFSKQLPGLTCPFCATHMVRCWIYDTGFERCATHGSWFTLDNLQAVLGDHAMRYAARNSDHTKLELFIVIPVIGVLAMPLQAIVRPWSKRRRLRKYLARTTPTAKP